MNQRLKYLPLRIKNAKLILNNIPPKLKCSQAYFKIIMMVLIHLQKDLLKRSMDALQSAIKKKEDFSEKQEQR